MTTVRMTCLLIIIVFRVILVFFFFNDTATTEIYTLSLHDALPISSRYELRHPHARRHQPLGVAQGPAHALDGGPHLVRYAQGPLHPGAHQHQHELVAP